MSPIRPRGQTIRRGGAHGASYKRSCFGSITSYALPVNGFKLPQLPEASASGVSYKRSCIGFGKPRVLNSGALIDPRDLKRVRSGYAKKRLGDRLLAEAQATQALNSVASINPHDLEIIKNMLLLCVLL